MHPNPTPAIDAWPSTGGCEGEPVVLTGDGCYEKYCWNPGGPCTKSFEAKRSATYELNVIDRWGCEGSATHTVSFLDPPTANAGSDRSECSGGADPSLGGSPAATGGTPPYVYNWTGSGAPYLSSSSSANPTFDAGAASPGVYNLYLEVVDANGCSDTDGPVVVTVYELPVASITATTPVCPGDAIDFSGGATGGLGPYSYTWSGPDGFASFTQNPTISSAVEANQGTYTLTVTDGHGCSSIPATYAVIVDDPATISTPPSDMDICEGGDAVFTVSASGTPPFTFQWERSTNSGSTWNPIGTDSDTYTATSVGYSMDGYMYRCAVLSVCSPPATSAAATLGVLLPPSVTGPSNVSADLGTAATFTVSATGESPFSYSWQRSTDAGSSWSSVGSDSPSYTTPTTTEDMDGYQYRCIVSGTCTPADTSAVATLTVVVDLYEFTEHLFTPCGAEGRQGPTLTQCRSSYSPTPAWDLDPALFTVTGTGIQQWTVPADGTYRITAAGARGGYYGGQAGRGVIIRGDFTLTRGRVLNIIPGQHGEGDDDYTAATMYDTGGGGGSFVWVTTSAPLIAAGGGGGHCYEFTNLSYADAVYTGCGQNSYCTGDCYETYSGGCSGLGGESHAGYPIGAGGAGFLGNGDNSSLAGGGQAIISGGLGGTGEYSDQPAGQGGFGGGGGSARDGSGGRQQGPGGGGGYSGGAGSDDGSPGGGGSFNGGTSTSNLGYNSGDGYVRIQKI